VESFRHLYLHLPFCRHKCGYCDFNAYAGMDRLMPEYVDGLLRELSHARATRQFEPLRSVYLGGGTPSLLPADLMARLLARVAATFETEPGAEVTLEANPASTDPDKLAAWRRGGVNRLSLGVQGFDPAALAVLERRTDGREAVRALREARAAGFDDVNLDLIYAVPGQTLAAWTDTVRRALELEPEHLSCYCLTVEEGTLLHRRRAEGRLTEVLPDLAWEQLDAVCELLAAAGYERYEVSNWSRPGRRARHNQAYWDCRPVYGAGAGAHSYATDGERAWRWWNVARPRDYLAALPQPIAGGEELDPRLRRAERVMLGLRTVDGVAPPPELDSTFAQLAEAGLVTRSGDRVVPTRRGLDLHNQVALAVL
jgi:putative oxygen-independent coproporphyrinogen III oxidase